MAKSESTGKKISSAASIILHSKTTSAAEKAVAASALTQTKSPKETTSKRVAAAAAQILRDPRASKEAKSVAASALMTKTKPKIDMREQRAIYDGVRAYFDKKK